jgi:hypothetical protein
MKMGTIASQWRDDEPSKSATSLAGAVAEFVTCWPAVMKAKKSATNEMPSVLDVVALLTDLPAQRISARNGRR